MSLNFCVGKLHMDNCIHNVVYIYVYGNKIEVVGSCLLKEIRPELSSSLNTCL